MVARLKAAGAVLVGKTNMDEFGMGSFNMHSHYGPCISPWQSRQDEGALRTLQSIPDNHFTFHEQAIAPVD